MVAVVTAGALARIERVHGTWCRLQPVRSRALLVLALVACTHGCTEPAISYIDVGPRPDTAVYDGGRCIEEPFEVACQHLWYGSTCEVPCDFPDGCTFDLHITWSSCVSPDYGDDWVDCLCLDGLAQCRNNSLAGLRPRMTPANYCEFFRRPDGDVSGDGGVEAHR
jgi:hypothetical protein